MDQLVAFDGGHDRLEVGHDRGAVADERYPAETGDQRFPTLIALHGDLEADPGTVVSVDAPLARRVWLEALQLYQEQGRDTDAERVQRQLDYLDNPSSAGDGLDDR